MSDLERRFTGGELRADIGETGFAPTIRGYAIVFGLPSEDLGGFREIIHPDAMRRTLEEGIDLRAFVDHDAARIIGRLSAGTLRAKPDARGLAVEIDAPNTSHGRDIVESIRRRDVSGMSFAFRTLADDWAKRGGEIIRTVLDMRVSEVSVVSQPAYPDTTAAVRALQAFQGRPIEHLRREHWQRVARWR